MIPPFSNFYSPPVFSSNYRSHFNFFDLDSWVHEAIGTEEYNDRCAVAQQIMRFLQYPSTQMIIEGSNLTSLPNALGYLKQLEELKICNNQFIKHLPADIVKLHNLTTLILDNLCIANLPHDIGNLSLRKLAINNTSILTLPPDIGGWSNLEELQIINSSLKFLPNEIGNCKNLKLLNLSKNPQLFSLPKTIGSLKNLQIIDLQNCNFSYLPKEIFSLEKLHYLNLQGCPFSANALELLQSYITPSRRIAYSQETARITLNIERSLEEHFKNLYRLSNTKEKLVFNIQYLHRDVESLRIFLDKFSYTEDLQRKNPKNVALAKKLIEYISLAQKTKNYRERFFAALKEGSDLEGRDKFPLYFSFLALRKSLLNLNLMI